MHDGRATYAAASRGEYEGETARPSPPTIIKMMPTVARLSPLTDVLTAKYRIAPAAMRKMLMPVGMTFCLLSGHARLGDGVGSFLGQRGTPLAMEGRSTWAESDYTLVRRIIMKMITIARITRIAPTPMYIVGSLVLGWVSF